MSTVALERRYTPEDLLTMPDGDRYELVDGELVERDMGWDSSRIGGRLYRYLSSYCEDNGLGWVAPADADYQCFPDAPDKVRKPDASYIRLDRLPASRKPLGHCPIAPDAAAEVVSPNDSYSDVEVKVDEYLRAGVCLVWVIDPVTRSVRVHRQDGSVTDLTEKDYLDGENVIPGFKCRVGDLFLDPGARIL
jgi:Uma2 family endonuclease